MKQTVGYWITGGMRIYLTEKPSWLERTLVLSKIEEIENNK